MFSCFAGHGQGGGGVSVGDDNTTIRISVLSVLVFGVIVVSQTLRVVQLLGAARPKQPFVEILVVLANIPMRALQAVLERAP